MKKLLLASTALVATAGVAQADVALSGSAEMGIYGATDVDTQFFTDVDVTFTMSGEADNGLTFGANVDLDESDGSGSCELDNDGGGFANLTINETAANVDGAGCSVQGNSNAFDPDVQGGESIFVSFGGATLTMGDTDGALDARVPEMALAGGSIADDETAHNGFDNGAMLDGDGGDGQIARFDYAFGPAIFSVSAEQDEDGEGDEPVIGVGVSYAGDLSGIDMNVGLGYQKQEDNGALTSLAITGGFGNGLSLGATFSGFDDDSAADEDTRHVGLGLGYEMNALALGLNWGQFSDDDGDVYQSGYGLAAVYDLGGGISLRAGYGFSEEDGEDDSDTFSLGAKMSF